MRCAVHNQSIVQRLHSTAYFHFSKQQQQTSKCILNAFEIDKMHMLTVGALRAVSQERGESSTRSWQLCRLRIYYQA